MKTRVFLRRPDVPGFWPSIGLVLTVVTSRGSAAKVFLKYGLLEEAPIVETCQTAHAHTE